MFDVSHLLRPSDAPGPIRVTVQSWDGLMGDLEARMSRRQGFSLATLNLDHIVKIVRDPVFREAYARHSIVTADGNPVVWLCRLAGQPVSLVPGADLVAPVAGLAARLDVPVALLGSTGGSLDTAAAELMASHPDLRIVARIAPEMGFRPDGPEADAAISEIAASGARLVFLALGAPKQEIFAVRAQAALPEVGFLSIGAGLDFLSGTQTRAPRLVRMLAAEWLWRLLSNPGRLALRYAACFAILPRAGLVAIRARAQDHREGI